MPSAPDHQIGHDRLLVRHLEAPAAIVRLRDGGDASVPGHHAFGQGIDQHGTQVGPVDLWAGVLVRLLALAGHVVALGVDHAKRLGIAAREAGEGVAQTRCVDRALAGVRPEVEATALRPCIDRRIAFVDADGEATLVKQVRHHGTARTCPDHGNGAVAAKVFTGSPVRRLREVLCCEKLLGNGHLRSVTRMLRTSPVTTVHFCISCTSKDRIVRFGAAGGLLSGLCSLRGVDPVWVRDARPPHRP